jgi:hypothetical protein
MCFPEEGEVRSEPKTQFFWRADGHGKKETLRVVCVKKWNNTRLGRN